MQIQEPIIEERKIEKNEDDPSDFEITPESQIFDAFSSDNNSQEALQTSFKAKQRRQEDGDSKVFENCLFVVFDVSREPLGTVLILKSQDDDNVTVNFRITLRGHWIRTPIDHGDIVRIIGQFKKSNQYTLTLDDDEPDPETGALYLILEPYILIPSTTIVSSFPCVRRSIFADQFRTNLGDFEYPLVIGNIIHEAFERVILKQRFDDEYLEQVYKESMKNHICHLYKLAEPDVKVFNDLKLAAKNIQNWVSNMLDRKSFLYYQP
ncbi:dna replication atp-dependent helicase dna2 [Stylonychia lemnae]|uniref:Dna replication atp-dependent helicase dna2 n=1 Tax=Stylonychia lemnae TaxID=5949 RepID=A0A078BBA8_STYLE|nr:dna replication atp-dependent helicase dna2 [Stylonychia lemnae]|eukprot:CDW90542.1 dna replication atp-dependent helicase dna2 [Stylonychia lemnae]